MQFSCPTVYEEWHVPGSENADDELQNHPGAPRDALPTIPENDEVVVTCTAGGAFELAAQHLRRMGHEVKTLACTHP